MAKPDSVVVDAPAQTPAHPVFPPNREIREGDSTEPARDPAAGKILALAERVRATAKALDQAQARLLSVRGALEQAEQNERNAANAFAVARAALLAETIGDANVGPR